MDPQALSGVEQGMPTAASNAAVKCEAELRDRLCAIYQQAAPKDCERQSPPSLLLDFFPLFPPVDVTRVEILTTGHTIQS